MITHSITPLFFHENLACGACFPQEIFFLIMFVCLFVCLFGFASFRDAFHLKFLILSTNSLVVKMNQTPILSDLNNTIYTKQ